MPTLPKSYTRTWHPSSPERRAAVLALLVLALCAAAALSLRCGSQDYTLAQLADALWGGGSGTVRRILLHVRIPRTLAAALAGGALALSGALIQAVLNNSMASPNVIGVNAGSNTITLLAPDSLAGASSFMMGGFSGVTLAAIGRSGWYLAVGAALALFLSVELNVLQLGEESAASLGLHVGRVRFMAILAAALLAGAAVSFSGLLGFVGLLVPHMVRRLVGSDNRWLLPAAALLGGSFVLVCDMLARVLFAPFELPVGIVMSLLGGPFFLYLLLRRKGGRVYA